MTVYLLHFSEPFGHARHYLGWAPDGAAALRRRLAKHDRGAGSVLTAAATAAGITLTLARTWPGSRAEERRMKGRTPHGSKGHGYRCPVCKPMPRIDRWAGGQP